MNLLIKYDQTFSIIPKKRPNDINVPELSIHNAVQYLQATWSSPEPLLIGSRQLLTIGNTKAKNVYTTYIIYHTYNRS